jgi:hypothetical protein
MSAADMLSIVSITKKIYLSDKVPFNAVSGHYSLVLGEL